MDGPAGAARPPQSSPAMLLALHGRAVTDALEAALREEGLTLRQLGILGHLQRDPGLSFTDLAGRARITVQSVHTIVQHLIEAGLVSATDRVRGRAALLELSPAGRDRLADAEQAVRAVDQAWFGPDADPAWQALGDALRAARPQDRQS